MSRKDSQFKVGHKPWNTGLTGIKIGGCPKKFVDVERCKKLHDEGLSFNQISKIIGVNQNTIIRRLDEKNIKRRTRSEAMRSLMNRPDIKKKFNLSRKIFWADKKNHQRMSEVQKNLPEAIKLKRLKKSRLYKKNHKTTPEKLVEKIVREFGFDYVGNGKVFVKRFNPDFINKAANLIIEVFGDYWHRLPRYADLDKRRLKTYEENNFRCLVIWEYETKNLNLLRKRIKEFIWQV